MAHCGFSSDAQNPNPNPNPKSGRSDVLCIISYRRVYMLDMDEIMSDEDYKDGTSPKPPPLKRVLDFLNSGLPLGMGLLKSGNFLYMFGGEYLVGHSFYEDFGEKYPFYDYDAPPAVCGCGIPVENAPCPVFRLDLTADDSKPVPLRSMLGPKLFPVVVQIEGRIYVLSDRILSDRPIFDRPVFEVWNPVTEEWRALPNPPCSPESYQIMGHCVVGRDIICAIGYTFFYRFSTVSEKWESLKELSSRREVMAMAMDGRFDVRYDDVYLRMCKDVGWCKLDDTLWAIIDGPERTDYNSVAVDSVKTRPHIPDCRKSEHVTLVDTSEQGDYMCGLIPYTDSGKSPVLYVFVFQVEKVVSEKGSQSQAPLSVRYLRRQVYDFNFVRLGHAIEWTILWEAVVGRVFHITPTGSGECSRVEANRKRKVVVDDDDDDDIIATSSTVESID